MRSAKKTKIETNTPPHVTRGDVFGDLGFSEEEALSLKIKADLHSSILKMVKTQGYTQRDLQKMLDQPQPRVSELLNGKISKMSIEKLLTYLTLLGGSAKLVVQASKAA